MCRLAQYWRETDGIFHTHVTKNAVYYYCPLFWTARRNQKRQRPNSLRYLFDSLRQTVEFVNARLVEQFHIEKNHAHLYRGPCARLDTGLTAHTLYIHIKQAAGAPSCLQIRKLAVPNRHKTLLTETMDRRQPATDALATERILNCPPISLPPPHNIAHSFCMASFPKRGFSAISIVARVPCTRAICPSLQHGPERMTDR